MEKRVLILLSGGLDSITLAKACLPRLHSALFVDYGQPAEREERMASHAFAEAWGIQWRCVEVPMMGVDVLSGEEATGRIVPGRNLLLLSTAINVALCTGASEIFIGICSDDNEYYPDCQHDFVESVQEIARIYGIEVRAPWIGMRKTEIVELAKHYGVNIDRTWSCYSPREGKPCGECLPCQQRKAMKAE